MKPNPDTDYAELEAFSVSEGQAHQVQIHDHHGSKEINLGQEADGLLQIYVHERGEQELYAKVVMEIGHHHHHGLHPLGLPLEIVPIDYSHARMGESYEIQVLKTGQPLAGAEVKVTYASTRSMDYPHRLKANEDGRAKVFLSARGNYLFSVTMENVVSTFTLVKSF
ncbi:MAG TPA: DUF4198 domain-containing protein [Syntrophomonas sp.]|nr:DUF4198 domain-containing protein [Syntrophomonas sp.]